MKFIWKISDENDHEAYSRIIENYLQQTHIPHVLSNILLETQICK